MKNNRVKFRHQLEANDCGPACVQMICEFYGKKYKLSDIKKHLSISKLGVSIKDLRGFLDDVGFNSATVKINIDDAKENAPSCHFISEPRAFCHFRKNYIKKR